MDKSSKSSCGLILFHIYLLNFFISIGVQKMPNIVKTKLKVQFLEEKELDRLQTAIENNNLLHTYIPIPEKMIPIPAWSTSNNSRPEITQRETLQNLNLVLTGYRNESDFIKRRWGTKWDIYPGAKVNRLDCYNLTTVIETAWDAPIPLFMYLSGLGMKIDALFIDEVPNFIGFYNTFDGSQYLEINQHSELPKPKNGPRDIFNRFKNEMNFDVFEHVEAESPRVY
jgi:hypothetical protein